MIRGKAAWFAQASRSARWLVGVSGGADSVALLHGLVELGFTELVVCHLDHGLRGDEGLGDAEFVEEMAGKLGLVCERGRAAVRQRMAERGESLETAARLARHDFFAECAVKHGVASVLLAHHADDQAETVLWNLLRGSHGHKGMNEVQTMVTEGGVALDLVRPLLGLRRAELRAWLQERGISWREDASNAEPIGIRNRLRNEVFPCLAEISGRDAVAAFSRAAADAAEAAVLEYWAVEQAKLLDPQGRLHVGAMRSVPRVLQALGLRKFLREQGIGEVDRSLIERGLCENSVTL